VAAPRFRTVIFDIDSTLSAIEGIDELAGAHASAVSALTDAAMRGEVPLEEVYGARLELIKPDRAAIDALADRYVAAAVPGAREAVRALQSQGVEVRILSGGIRQAIGKFAAWLDLPADRVTAVDVHFDEAGHYAGFDRDSPLTRSGGKRVVLEGWRGRIPGPVLMVGDGITDLETRPAVDRFVAFAGVVERPEVTAAADAVIRDPSLLPVLAEVLHMDRG
jgi:phosphoserine phosphatase